MEPDYSYIPYYLRESICECFITIQYRIAVNPTPHNVHYFQIAIGILKLRTSKKLVLLQPNKSIFVWWKNGFCKNV